MCKKLNTAAGDANEHFKGTKFNQSLSYVVKLFSILEQLMGVKCKEVV